MYIFNYTLFCPQCTQRGRQAGANTKLHRHRDYIVEESDAFFVLLLFLLYLFFYLFSIPFKNSLFLLLYFFYSKKS